MNKKIFATYGMMIYNQARQMDKICEVTGIEIGESIVGDMLDTEVDLLCLICNHHDDEDFMDALFGMLWPRKGCGETTEEDFENFYDDWSNK